MNTAIERELQQSGRRLSGLEAGLALAAQRGCNN